MNDYEKRMTALMKADVLISIATFDEGVKLDEVERIKAEIREAAHLPYRNCDVGTYQEQTTRFFIFCRQHLSPIHGMCSSSCPCCGQPDMCHCFSKWMHMEYKEESESKKACSETPSSWKRRAE